MLLRAFNAFQMRTANPHFQLEIYLLPFSPQCLRQTCNCATSQHYQFKARMLSHREKHATNKKGSKHESGRTGRQEETKFSYHNYEAKEQISFEVSKCIWFPSKLV